MKKKQISNKNFQVNPVASQILKITLVVGLMLAIVYLASAGDIIARAGTFNVSDKFFIDSSGNVGIGTATPTGKLEVNGNIVTSMPTASNHVATKAYVDAAAAGASSESLVPFMELGGINYGDCKMVTSPTNYFISGTGYNISCPVNYELMDYSCNSAPNNYYSPPCQFNTPNSISVYYAYDGFGNVISLEGVLKCCLKAAESVYFSEGGNPSYCKKISINSFGVKSTVNINENNPCDGGMVCKSGVCTVDSSIVLIGGLHTGQSCIADGGEVVAVSGGNICRFDNPNYQTSATYCPSGWTTYNNYGTRPALNLNHMYTSDTYNNLCSGVLCGIIPAADWGPNVVALSRDCSMPWYDEWGNLAGCNYYPTMRAYQSQIGCN